MITQTGPQLQAGYPQAQVGGARTWSKVRFNAGGLLMTLSTALGVKYTWVSWPVVSCIEF